MKTPTVLLLGLALALVQGQDLDAQAQQSLTNAGRPIVYGLDSLHGANYVKDAVLFPQQVNIGATFNPTFAKTMGSTAGRDTKAAGIPWVFTPCLDVSRHKGWPRTYERMVKIRS
ncbi:hypothetical protein Ae201684P_011965 [Aphanomyces euteiches]|nr:hypothetical protein Ae201684P_011965 [Aphanomyces euteiches]